MDLLLNKFGQVVNGVISGFDRIVFKGMLRPIMFAQGMQFHLRKNGILNKDFKNYAIGQSKLIIESAQKISQESCGRDIEYISSLHTRKESLAHERQKETGITEGLIGVWSCVETCHTFRSTFNPSETYPLLRSDQSRCKHLYFYFDDPTYGFMSIRLQTWAPYEIQISLNGREWLKRALDELGCGYILNGNKFLHIEDYELAQKLLDTQKNADFQTILDRFVPRVFPEMSQILGEDMKYYWILWQSEVAKDYLFESSCELGRRMDDFLNYSLINGTGERILKYFGSPVQANGQPHAKANPKIFSRANLWYDGLRVRHWNGKNSVKFYNEHNVLRFEMTMNDPSQYKIYRHTENQDKSEPKKLQPMRKGIADLSTRAEVSGKIVNRFSEHMSFMESQTSLGEVLCGVSKAREKKGKRIRALDVFGKDLEFMRALSDPAWESSGVRNKDLQKKLKGTLWAKGMSDSQLSARISRHLSLMREHGLLKKMPNQRRYSLTNKGAELATSICAALAASVNDLLKSAA